MTKRCEQSMGVLQVKAPGIRLCFSGKVWLPTLFCTIGIAEMHSFSANGRMI